MARENAFFFYLFLLAFIALFPVDAMNIVNYLLLKTRVFVLNSWLYLRSYLAYRKLSRDLSALGLESPPFFFIKIEDRHQ
jgi:hypothetical protein